MVRWIILSVVVVALTAIATLVANLAPAGKTDGAFKISAKEGPSPKAKLDGDPTHDFGTMSQNTTGTHSWTVHNEGDADLELWMQSSTCMCTIAKFADQKRAVVKPGESTQIDLEWETRDSMGEFSKGATIGTNDPAQPSFPLNVKGIVHPPIIVIPNDRIVPIGSISSDEAKTAYVAFFAPEQPDMKILKVATSQPDLIVVTPEPLREEDLKSFKVKGGYRLKVDVKPGMPLGNFRDEVVVNTDNKLAPEVKLAVSGTVTGPISVHPERLRLINVTTARGGSGEATILVRGGKPTKFEVAQKPEKVDVQIASAETNTLKGRYRMTVSVPPGTPAERIKGNIVLKTDNPKAAEIVIPVDILVLGGGG
jgi:hypothetical protein